MEVTFSGTKYEIKKQFEKWYKSVDNESTTLYNRIVVTADARDKVKLSDYKRLTQEVAILNQIKLQSLREEIMSYDGVEKKRYKDGFYIRGIQIKEETK